MWTMYLLIKIQLFIRKPELHTPALVWFLSACVADILITAGLVFSLVRIEENKCKCCLDASSPEQKEDGVCRD